MSSYPKNLRLFRAWCKAMEQAAQVGTPDYGKTVGSSSSKTYGKKARRPRRKRIRRMRKRKMVD